MNSRCVLRLAGETVGFLCSVVIAAFLFLILLLFLAPTWLIAQNVESQIIAAQYGSWQVVGYAPSTYTFAPNTCRVQGGASFFNAFSVGVPIRIVDGNPSLSETVTPSAVTINNTTCAITISPAHQHNLPFYLTSATGGLQEAINAAHTEPAVNTVILDTTFYTLVGASNVSSTIYAASGYTQLGLVDVTQTPYVWYGWNGSHYVPIALASITFGSSAPSNPCSATGAQYFDTTGKILYVCPSGGGNWATAGSGGPPSGNQLQVLGVPANGGTNVPVQSLTLTTPFLPTVNGSVGTLIPTIGAALPSFALPADNGSTHDWTSSGVAAPPITATTSQINSTIGASALTLINGSSNNGRQPFANASQDTVTVNDPWHPTHNMSLADAGAVCNASMGNAVTVTQGSNQVVITTAGGFAHNPEPGESLSIVGTLGSGEQVAWEPIVTAYNSGTSTITTYDNAPFSGTGLDMVHGFDSTAQVQQVIGQGTPVTVPSGVPPGTGCLDHRIHMSGSTVIDGTNSDAILVGFPGEDVLDTFDRGVDSGPEAGTGYAYLRNFSIDVDTRIDARKQWEQVVTYPSLTCQAGNFTGCTVTTNQVAPVNRYIGRNSVHANNPMGPGWCTNGQSVCWNSIGSVTNGSPTVTVASPFTAPSVGSTVVFPYVTPAFKTTVTASSSGTVTLAANYPGATNAQAEFFVGTTFQTLAAAITSSATSLTVTLPIQPAAGFFSNFGSDGAVLIDSEIIGYHLTDNNGQLVRNLVRGEFGTTAATHSSGALMVSLNPFRPTVPYPVNVAYQSAPTPTGAEYYPAFAVGNVGLGFVEQSGADESTSPSNGLVQSISINGVGSATVSAAQANGSIGFLDQIAPYNMHYSDLTADTLYWGIAEALPIDNAPIGNALPDTSAIWNHIYTNNDLFNQWYQLGGSYSRHDGLEAHVAGGVGGWGDLIETNCEQYDSNQNPGVGPYQGQYEQVTGEWSSVYGEALNGDAGTNQSNYEPEQWCQPNGVSVDGINLYYGYQTFVNANNLTVAGSFGNTFTTAYPAVVYGTNNTFTNMLEGGSVPKVASSYGQNATIINYGTNNIFSGIRTNTASFSALGTPWNQNYPSADFLVTDNLSAPYVNSNGAVFLPADFSQQNVDVGSFATYAFDPNALYGQSVACINPASPGGGCETNFEPEDYQIEPGNRVAPITYTVHIQYKASAGTPTANLNVCVSTTPPVNNSCTTVVATQTVTLSTSWQTLELDNVNLASYAGDWIGMSLTNPSLGSTTYYIGGYELIPLATRYTAQGFRDTGLVSQPTIGTDTNGNLVPGTGGVISGLTTGYIPKATSATSIGNSLLDDGVTAANTLTYAGTGGIATPSLTGTGAGAGALTTAEGTAPAGVAGKGKDVLWADSTAHRFIFNANNAGPIDFVGIAAAATAGDCAKFATNGIDIMDAGAACASGSSLPSGTVGQMLYYAAAGTTVTPTSDLLDAPSSGTLGLMTTNTATQSVVTLGTASNANGSLLKIQGNTGATGSGPQGSGIAVFSQFSSGTSPIFWATGNASSGTSIGLGAPITTAAGFTATGTGVSVEVGRLNEAAGTTTGFSATTLIATAALSNGSASTLYTLKCGGDATASASGVLTITASYTGGTGVGLQSAAPFATVTFTAGKPASISYTTQSFNDVTSATAFTLTGTLAGTATYSLTCTAVAE